MAEQTKISKPISKASKAIAQIQRKKNAEQMNARAGKSQMSFLDSVQGGIVQAKIKIGKPNDKYEVEADQMADKVMRMPSPDAKVNQTADLLQSKQANALEIKRKLKQAPGPEITLKPKQAPALEITLKPKRAPGPEITLKPKRAEALEAQRKCNTCEGEGKGEEQPQVQKKKLQFSSATDRPTNSLQRTPINTSSLAPRAAEGAVEGKAIRKQQMRPLIQRKEEDEDKIQRNSTTDRGRGPPRSDFSSKLSQSKGSGQPMDSGTNSFMSSRFGTDFSGVKIHTGSEASNMSTNISAKAFTHQNHIYFNQGQYQPETHSGKTLLAHELTHTIQQGAVGSSVQPKLKAGSPNDKYEHKPSSIPNALAPQGINLGPKRTEVQEVQRKTWEKEEQYNPYSTATKESNNVQVQRKCTSCEDEAVQRKTTTNPTVRGPPNNQLTADNTGQIRRGFWDDPLGSVGGALAGAAEWVGDSLSAGVTWLKGELSDMARNMPGYNLFAVVIGEDPITRAAVERNGRNFIEAGLDIIPNGADYKRKLEEDGGLDQAAAWLDNEMNQLDFRASDVASDFSRFISGVELSDIASPGAVLTRGVNVFRPYITRLITFARNVAVKLLEIVKEIAIEALLTFVRDQTPWYPLMTVVLGEDPITGDEVERNGMNILRGFILLHPEGDAQLAQMEESGSLQRAADWVDESIIRVTQIISGLRNGFTTMWETFSITNLLSPIETFNQIYGLFNQPVSELISFALEVAIIILQFIKDALIARLIVYARTIPGYNLVTVIMGKDLFSEEPVDRSAMNIIRGFMGLVPGGEEKFQEMQQTGAIQEALAWIEGAIEELDLTWGMVRGIFTTAWNTFSLADLATPIQTFGRVMDLFGAPLFRLIRFVGRVVLKLVEIALRLMGFPFELIGSIMARAQEAYELIKNDPIGFLKNLLRAVKQAFVQFFGNILTHLMNGVGEWLFGQLGDSGITIPSDFSFQSILGLIFQILGITRERIFEKIREKVGPERWAQIEGTLDTLTGVWSFVSDVVTRGPIAIWEKVQEQLSGLWDMVMSAARNWIMTRIIAQVTVRLLSMLDPTGIMAVVNSFMVFFSAVQSAIQYMIPMLEMVNNFLGGVVQIAQGNIQPAADFLERTMARGMPILIGFMANQVGLGSIGSRIREVIESIQERVDGGIQWAIDRAWELGSGLLQMGRNAVGSVVQWWRMRKSFSSDGESHSVYFNGGENNARLTVASDPLAIDRWLVVRETALRGSNEFNGDRSAAHGRIKNVLLPELTATTSPPVSGASDGSRTMDQILTDIVSEVQTVGVASEETLPVPRMAVTPGFSNGRASTHITARYIYNEPNNHLPGGDPRDSNLREEFDELSSYGIGGGEWVRFHLINEHLGGLPVNSNLVPLPRALNTDFSNQFEEPLKALFRGDNGDKKPVWYNIRLIYHRSGSKWLTSISVQGGKMKIEGGQWVNGRGITPWSRTRISKPEAGQNVSISSFINDPASDVSEFKKRTGLFDKTIALLQTRRGESIIDVNEVERIIDEQVYDPTDPNGWSPGRKENHKRQFRRSRDANRVQRKLKVGSPNDPMELEADQMADKVMRMPAASSDGQKTKINVIQRVTKYRPRSTEALEVQRKEHVSSGSTNNSFDNGVSASKGTGRPMDSSTQSFMENRFGTDFSGVNIHTDSNSANLSNQIQAKAFTTGNDIYFNQGEYNPSTTAGKKLLAHELTHTIQQGASPNVQNKVQRKGFFAHYTEDLAKGFQGEMEIDMEETTGSSKGYWEAGMSGWINFMPSKDKSVPDNTKIGLMQIVKVTNLETGKVSRINDKHPQITPDVETKAGVGKSKVEEGFYVDKNFTNILSGKEPHSKYYIDQGKTTIKVGGVNRPSQRTGKRVSYSEKHGKKKGTAVDNAVLTDSPKWSKSAKYEFETYAQSDTHNYGGVKWGFNIDAVDVIGRILDLSKLKVLSSIDMSKYIKVTPTKAQQLFTKSPTATDAVKRFKKHGKTKKATAPAKPATSTPKKEKKVQPKLKDEKLIQRTSAGKNFEVTGIMDPKDQDPDTVYFARKSAALTKDQNDKIIDFMARNMGSAEIFLYGFGPEEEEKKEKDSFIRDRLNVVEASVKRLAKKAVKVHVVARPKRSKKSYKYRKFRAVELSAAEIKPGREKGNTKTRNCNATEVKTVEKVRGMVNTNIDNALAKITAYQAKPADNLGVEAVIDRNFKSHSPKTLKKIVKILKLLKRDLAKISSDKRRQCGSIDHSICASAHAFASSQTRITFCPKYFNEDPEPLQQRILVHEMGHFLKINLDDRGYSHNRVFKFLSTKEALQNTDSFAIMINEFNGIVNPDTPNTLVDPSKDKLLKCGANQSKVEEAFARAQRWNGYAETSFRQIYANWTNFKYMQRHLIPLFGSYNRYSVAGMIDRAKDLKKAYKLDFNFNCLVAEDPLCKGKKPVIKDAKDVFNICPSFFKLSKKNRIIEIGKEITKLIPSIPDKHRLAYAKVGRAFKLFFFQDK